MRVICSQGSAGQAVSLGPAPSYRIDRRVLYTSDGSTVFGRYAQHYWEVQGHHYTRCDCDKAASVRFEGPNGAAQEFGPFDQVSIVDGAIRADGRLLATFSDDTESWHCTATNSDWPIVVITKA